MAPATYERFDMKHPCNSLANVMLRAVLASACACTSAAIASEVRYEFAASEMFTSNPTFGLPAPSGLVTGRFSYDPATPPNYTIPRPDADCRGYRQQRPGGFTAKFGDIEVVADDYVVEVFNDLSQGPGIIADVVTVIASSDLTPPVNSQLKVNGIPRPAGQFLVSFLHYGGSLFDSPDLSNLEGLESFGWAGALLGDTGHRTDASADVVANLESLVRPLTASADFDRDDDVDGADLLIWQRNLGDSGTFGGDANRDEIVDAVDLAAWREQFSSPTITASTIPEPCAGVLALAALLPLAVSRRTGRMSTCL